jgi:hypothetical protein
MVKFPKIVKKIIPYALFGSAIFSLYLKSHNNIYKTIPFDSIPEVSERGEIYIKKVDYDTLTWEETVKYIKTPKQTYDYFKKYFKYKKRKGIYIPGLISLKEKNKSFKELFSEKEKNDSNKLEGNCLNYADAAITLLYDNGYPPIIMDIKDGKWRHSIFVYKTSTGYGALGNNSLNPIYPDIHHLSDALYEIYGVKVEKYSIINLDDNFKDKEWIYGNVNLQLGIPRIGLNKLEKKVH